MYNAVRKTTTTPGYRPECTATQTKAAADYDSRCSIHTHTPSAGLGAEKNIPSLQQQFKDGEGMWCCYYGSTGCKPGTSHCRPSL